MFIYLINISVCLNVLNQRAVAMFNSNDIKLEFIQSGQMALPRTMDGYIHRKATPELIVAQAYEGHYELSAGAEFAALRSGECFITRPDQPLEIWHYVDPDSGIFKSRWAHLKVSFIGGLDLFSLLELPLHPPESFSHSAGEILIKLIAMNAEDNLQSAVRRISLTFELLDLLIAISRPSPHFEIFIKNAEKLLPLLEFIHHNLAQPASVNVLAAKLNMSRAAFYAFFMKNIGIPPARYIEEQRMKAAAEKLRIPGKYSVNETAELLGFKNQFHFSKVFKRIYQMSPAQYRKSRTENMW